MNENQQNKAATTPMTDAERASMDTHAPFAERWPGLLAAAREWVATAKHIMEEIDERTTANPDYDCDYLFDSMGFALHQVENALDELTRDA